MIDAINVAELIVALVSIVYVVGRHRVEIGSTEGGFDAIVAARLGAVVIIVVDPGSH